MGEDMTTNYEELTEKFLDDLESYHKKVVAMLEVATEHGDPVSKIYMMQRVCDAWMREAEKINKPHVKVAKKIIDKAFNEGVFKIYNDGEKEERKTG